MNRLLFALLGIAFLSQPAYAEQTFDLGDVAKLSVSGFAKAEASRATNQSTGLVNCGFTNDPRGVFGTYCLPGQAETNSPPSLFLTQLSSGLSHEFDSAWKIDSRLTYRLRNGKADIFEQKATEQNIAVSHLAPIVSATRSACPALGVKAARAMAFSAKRFVTTAQCLNSMAAENFI
jgi:hypothetical protein